MSQNDIYNIVKYTDYDYYIIEGYEFTGKSYLIDYLANSDCNLEVYNPRKIYDIVEDSTRLIPYEYRYILVLALVSISCNKRYLIDRGIVSSLVYSKLYSQNNNLWKSDVLYKLSDYIRSKKILNIYIAHNDINNAESLYNMSLSRINEDYDKFSSFSDYFKNYIKFDKLFKEVLNFIGNDHIICSSLDCEVLYDNRNIL